MNILLTNDDGIDAFGLEVLAGVLRARHEVTIAAPAGEQSGIGHAFTFNTPLRCEHTTRHGLKAYAVAGTPADCVKFAVSRLLPREPDVIVSGMNIGENSGTSSIYSGTVAAAREGALWSIPAVAFSVTSADRGWLAEYAARTPALIDWFGSAEAARFFEQHPQTFLNVNYPPCAPAQCRGEIVTRQSLAFFDDHYRRVDTDTEPPGFMLYGEKQNLESSVEYDSRALLDDYATITPLSIDSTDRRALSYLRALGSAPGAAPDPDASSTRGDTKTH